MEQLRQTWENESQLHKMFRRTEKAETEKCALCQAKIKVAERKRQATHGSRFGKSDAHVKA